CEQPAERQLQQRMAAPLRKAREFLNDRQVLLVEPVLRPARSDARPLGERPSLAVLAGEQAVGERKVGEEGEPEPLAFREDVVLRIAVEEAELVLDADEARGAGARRRLRLAQLVHGEV